MKLYCLCEAQPGTPGAGKPDAQVFWAPNRYCSVKDPLGKDLPAEKFPPVALQRPMRVLAMGVAQVVFPGPMREQLVNDWTGGMRPSGFLHYPMVDVLECPVCRSRVVLEGSGRAAPSATVEG
jgi:hypothetical protein